MLDVAELFITDGTEYVDLLFHFKLAQWKPKALTYKDGGVVQTSSLGDQSRLVMRQYDNQVEAMTLIVKGGHQSAAIFDLRRLRQMLEKAADYQTGWPDTPIYIGARSVGDNHTRYAVVVRGLVPEDPDPYTLPFVKDGDGNSLGMVELSLEHWFWLENVPGTGVAAKIAGYGVEGAGNTVTGTVDNGSIVPVVSPSTGANVFLTPKSSLGCISRAYYETGVGASANLIQAGVFVSHTLFEHPQTLNYALYLGSFLTDPSSAPFCNVVFDIGVKSLGGLAIVPEYWNGAAWVTLPDYIDLTANFAYNGVLSLSFQQPSDWDTTAILGIAGSLGWWIRLRIDATGGVTPTQQNRNIYTVTWPWVEVEDSESNSDIPALAEWRLHTMQDFGGPNHTSRIIAGLRSNSRGADFQAYINLGDAQNPAIITVALVGAALGFVDAIEAPSARAALFSAAAGATADVEITITSRSYKGGFRAYLRCDQDLASAGDFSVKMGTEMVYFSSGRLYGDVIYTKSLAAWQLLDLGTFDILPDLVASDTLLYGFKIILTIAANAAAVAASATLKLYDLILIPTDEWKGEFNVPVNAEGMNANDVLSIDGIRDPRRVVRAIQELTSGTPLFASIGLLSKWEAITNHYPILQRLENQRLWVLALTYDTTDWFAYPWLTMSVKLNRMARYSTMRGKE